MGLAKNRALQSVPNRHAREIQWYEGCYSMSMTFGKVLGHAPTRLPFRHNPCKGRRVIGLDREVTGFEVGL